MDSNNPTIQNSNNPIFQLRKEMPMTFDSLRSPAAFLRQMLGAVTHENVLQEYETWWEKAGQVISYNIDRAGTPWLRMFDQFGKRVDEILYPPEYWQMLKRGYRAGVIWRAFAERSLLPSYLLGYVTSFYDPGLYCPYTVSLSTAAPLEKYGSENLQARFLPQMLQKDETVWQGATWMTEIKGGSDLGAAVETIAKPAGDKWRAGRRCGAAGRCARKRARPRAVSAAAISGRRQPQLFHSPDQG
jgi:alkylation response protein AidB-like acyl-CoA dehydrogenase